MNKNGQLWFTVQTKNGFGQKNTVLTTNVVKGFKNLHCSSDLVDHSQDVVDEDTI